MSISISDIEKSSNPVYRFFFSNNELVKQWVNRNQLYKTVWRGKKESDNSFCLKKKDEYRNVIPQRLIDRFGITNKKLFLTKYYEAISGDGQEWTRITTLHSSSLLALLFFYNVTPNNKIKIGKYTFSDSFFEVRTQVHGESESNMDVVLRGCETDYPEKKVVLFLECKFSEYLNAGRYENISCEAYYDTYVELGLFNNIIPGLLFKGDKNTNISIELEDPRNRPIYCGGIKQMISHSMGVSKYALYRKDALGDHTRFKEDDKECVLLGEILFQFDTSITKTKESDKFNNYSEAYKDLAKIVNKKENSIVMFDHLLTYQNLLKENFDYLMEDNIRKFYKFNLTT